MYKEFTQKDYIQQNPIELKEQAREERLMLAEQKERRY